MCRPGSLRLVAIAALAAALATAAGSAQGVPAVPTAPLLRLLPDEVLIAVEIGDAGTLVDALDRFASPLPADLPDTVRAKIAAGILAANAFLRSSPTDLARTLAGEGAVVGFAPAGKSTLPFAVLRPAVPDAAAAFLARFPGKVHFARLGDLLLLSATEKGLATLQASAASPAGLWTTWRVEASPTRSEVHAHVDWAALRALLPAVQKVSVESLDGGGRWFLAPVAQALAQATRVSAVLAATEATVKIGITADGTVLGSQWQELMLHGGKEREVPMPPAGAVAMLALDRTLQPLFSSPERYLDEAGVLAVRAFLSVADQVDGHVSTFATDIAGGMQEPWTAYLVETPAPDDDSAPPLLLPGLAICGRMKEDKTELHLVRTATAFLVIVNQERARKQQAPFRQRAVRMRDVTGITAEPAPWLGPGLPPTEHGLSPTLLFGRGHVVLASTFAAADAVMARIEQGATVRVAGDALWFMGSEVAAALRASRGPIEIARALDESEPIAEAADFVAALIAVTDAVPRTVLTLRPGAASTTLDLVLWRRP